jgi:hypothetical protein
MKPRLSVLPKVCLIALGLLSWLAQPGHSTAKPESTSFLYLPLILNSGSSTTPAPTTPPPPSSTPTTPPPPANAYSLRFYGNGINDIDRVKIPVTANNASLPVNIGASDFTIEFWLRFAPNENNSGTCTEGTDTWIYGNIIFDRDIFGTPDYGDFGISLYGNRIAFGVHNGSSGTTICSNTTLSANTWHHVAVTRATSGAMRIYINGQLSRQANGPSGNIAYRVGRSITGNYVNEPYIVIGAEKHDYHPSNYPSFSGWIDEVRLSNTLRYPANFTLLLAPFTPDANTVGLYHFDEGSGTTVLDSSGASGGPSHGTRKVGGNPLGPVYDSNQKPF